MKRETLQAIGIVLALLLLCFADSFAQDNKSKYWQYSDSMFAARKANDTSMKNKYLDSMSKYCRFDARKLKTK